MQCLCLFFQVNICAQFLLIVGFLYSKGHIQSNIHQILCSKTKLHIITSFSHTKNAYEKCNYIHNGHNYVFALNYIDTKVCTHYKKGKLCQQKIIIILTLLENTFVQNSILSLNIFQTSHFDFLLCLLIHHDN